MLTMPNDRAPWVRGFSLAFAFWVVLARFVYASLPSSPVYCRRPPAPSHASLNERSHLLPVLFSVLASSPSNVDKVKLCLSGFAGIRVGVAIVDLTWIQCQGAEIQSDLPRKTRLVQPILEY